MGRVRDPGLPRSCPVAEHPTWERCLSPQPAPRLTTGHADAGLELWERAPRSTDPTAKGMPPARLRPGPSFLPPRPQSPSRYASCGHNIRTSHDRCSTPRTRGLGPPICRALTAWKGATLPTTRSPVAATTKWIQQLPPDTRCQERSRESGQRAVTVPEHAGCRVRLPGSAPRQPPRGTPSATGQEQTWAGTGPWCLWRST